jgi:hypothetical protein
MLVLSLFLYAAHPNREASVWSLLQCRRELESLSQSGEPLAAKEINEILVFGVRERGRLEGPSES